MAWQPAKGNAQPCRLLLFITCGRRQWICSVLLPQSGGAHLLQVEALDHLAQDALGIGSRLAGLICLPDGIQRQLHTQSLRTKKACLVHFMECLGEEIYQSCPKLLHVLLVQSSRV